jgi:hypothetical protein
MRRRPILTSKLLSGLVTLALITPPTVATAEEAIVEGSSLSMKVSLQDGEIPAEFGPASLFIDHWHGGHHHRRVHGRPHRRGGVVVVHDDDSHPGAALVTGLVVGAAVAHAADSSKSTSSSSQAATTKTTAENTSNTASKSGAKSASAAQQNVYVQSSGGAPAATPEQRLDEAKDMYDKGLIDEKEYEAKKAVILKDM